MEITRWLDVGDVCSEGEEIRTLWSTPSVRLVRIVSRGQSSPPGHWYDQDEHEYVLVLTGEAELEVEGAGRVRLGPGEGWLLPRRTRHRVERTSAEAPTVWLALFFAGELAPTLAPEAAARIVSHMNADHADSLRDYARTFGATPDTRSARMLEVDASGLTLEVDTSDGARQLRLPFERPVADPAEARGVLVAMAREARERLGSS